MPYDNLVNGHFIDEYVLLLFFIIDLHDGRKYKSGDDAYIYAKEPIDVRPYGSCHTSFFGYPGKTLTETGYMLSVGRRQTIWRPSYVGLCPRPLITELGSSLIDVRPYGVRHTSVFAQGR
ncbi:hypothetical protein DPMN_136898 [Dreissena polymorpha]|uniref:Uncharacterized protein n=1 Tax=Dreissena polymorpha TaxID=45954 RepID=A0A9D4G475_DREPO|nr:hypothetical protein DPMN_136898 [Dreissena polymorpha]